MASQVRLDFYYLPSPRPGMLTKKALRHFNSPIPLILKDSVLFLEDRFLLHSHFRVVHSVISIVFYKLAKTKNFISGFSCVPHTFDRPLEWNSQLCCPACSSDIIIAEICYNHALVSLKQFVKKTKHKLPCRSS